VLLVLEHEHLPDGPLRNSWDIWSFMAPTLDEVEAVRNPGAVQ
jgi:hypothetical protein